MKVLGFTRKELLGTSAYKLIHQGDVNYIAQKHVNGKLLCHIIGYNFP